MLNYETHFLISPWILLLIIPAVALTVWLFYRLDKRFRKSPNRIVSTVIYSLVMILCIFVLSGMTMSYDEENSANELVILVDASSSTDNARDRVDRYIYDVLKANDNRTQVAIVTFGYDQKVVVDMGFYTPEHAFNQYVSASAPNISATDISAALSLARELIQHPDSAKILLISDGLQTDQDARSLIKRMAMEGIKIDTTFYAGVFMDDVRIIDVSYPNRKLAVNENFEFELTLVSSYYDLITVTLTDENDNEPIALTFEDVYIEPGTQTITLPYSFAVVGHHELKFNIDSDLDTQVENNVYYSYCDLGEYSRVLFVEKYSGESAELQKILRQQKGEDVLRMDTVMIDDLTKLPATVDEMCDYDEIVLVNIAYADMPDGFEDSLYEYVYIRGGGLYTVGGFEKDANDDVVYEEIDGVLKPKAHSYVKDDMYGTMFERMLPVDIDDYSPPLALVIIIERSGAMASTSSGGGTKLDAAISGASACLEILSPDDFVGVIKLEDRYSEDITFNPMTKKDSILSNIRRIANQEIGGTNLTAALRHASSALAEFTEVERKHILIITDGNPSDSYGSYGTMMQNYHDTYGISVSVMSIDSGVISDFERLAYLTEGGAHSVAGRDALTMANLLKEDLAFDDISGAVEMSYSPKIHDETSIVNGITQELLDSITMQGFFSTRLKSSGYVDSPLYAKYVPLYAQWNYGRGKVGSFMCDLTGFWSSEFIDSDEVGVPILNRIVSALTPAVDLRSQTINATFTEDNYRTRVSILDFNGREDTTHKLIAFIKSSGKSVQKFDLSELSPTGNRFTFETLTPGIHELVILKVNKSFDVFNESIRTYQNVPSSQISGIYKSYRIFSYSKEYDTSQDVFTDGKDLLIDISTREVDGDAEEKLVYDAELIFENFELIHIEYDPRQLFVSLALVLFLIDIAIRLFKFKSPRKLLNRSQDIYRK